MCQRRKLKVKVGKSKVMACGRTGRGKFGFESEWRDTR